MEFLFFFSCRQATEPGSHTVPYHAFLVSTYYIHEYTCGCGGVIRCLLFAFLSNPRTCITLYLHLLIAVPPPRQAYIDISAPSHSLVANLTASNSRECRPCSELKHTGVYLGGHIPTNNKTPNPLRRGSVTGSMSGPPSQQWGRPTPERTDNLDPARPQQPRMPYPQYPRHESRQFLPHGTVYDHPVLTTPPGPRLPSLSGRLPDWGSDARYAVSSESSRHLYRQSMPQTLPLRTHNPANTDPFGFPSPYEDVSSPMSHGRDYDSYRGYDLESQYSPFLSFFFIFIFIRHSCILRGRCWTEMGQRETKKVVSTKP